MAIVDVHRVFEDGRPLHERDLFPTFDPVFEIVEVLPHLGNEAVLPPVCEVLPVGREHRSQIGADLRGVLRVILGNPRVVHVAVFHGFDFEVGISGHRGRVQVPVDVLGDPVGGKGRPEPPEHVVTGQPPTADVEVHRGQWLGAVKVVVDPEETLLPLGFPIDREVLVPKELLYDLAFVGHAARLLS